MEPRTQDPLAEAITLPDGQTYEVRISYPPYTICADCACVRVADTTYLCTTTPLPYQSCRDINRGHCPFFARKGT
jgi:hypothetical protein